MISFVVLTHDRFELTQRCLASLAAAVRPDPIELILVDNASIDDITPLVDEFQGRFDRFTFRRHCTNESFATACNHAAAESLGTWLVFLNNDIEVEADCLVSIDRARRICPEAGVLGAKLRYPRSGRLQHAGIRQMLWGYVSNWGVGGTWDDPRVGSTCDMFAVTGALMAVDRSLFRRVGGFDDTYRWGYEDVDLCLSARAVGRRVLFVHDARAWHHESATLGAVRQQNDVDTNYSNYRRKWDNVLVPGEQAALEALRAQGCRRVAVFGTGRAAHGLHDVLDRSGIDVVAFTSSRAAASDERCCGRPIVPLDQLRAIEMDRVIVGTQAFFEVEEFLGPYDPKGQPIMPVINER
jgi:GT2 family glycosyltransferase